MDKHSSGKRMQGLTPKKTKVSRCQLLCDCLLKILCEDPNKPRDNYDVIQQKSDNYQRTLDPGATKAYRGYKTRCIDEPSPVERIDPHLPKAYAMRGSCYYH